MSAEYNATEHVQDSSVLELPFGTEIHLPSFDIPVPDCLQSVLGTSIHFGTKYMWLEVVAFLLCCLIFIPLARKIRTGEPVKGRFASKLNPK